MIDPEKTRQSEDRYEYFRRTLAEEREERRRRRKISYLLRTAAKRVYENLMSNKPLLLIYAAAMIALTVQIMTAAPRSLTPFLASLVSTSLLGVVFILGGSLKSWYGGFMVYCGLLLLIVAGLSLAHWLLRLR